MSEELEQAYGAMRWVYKYGMQPEHLRPKAVSDAIDKAFASYRVTQKGMPPPRPEGSDAHPQPPLPEAPGDVEASKVIEWLECEIEAIPTRYHGDPSYDHDAYWMKCEVRDLLKKAADIFAASKGEDE